MTTGEPSLCFQLPLSLSVTPLVTATAGVWGHCPLHLLSHLIFTITWQSCLISHIFQIRKLTHQEFLRSIACKCRDIDPEPGLRTSLLPTVLDPKQRAAQPVRAVSSRADFRSWLRVFSLWWQLVPMITGQHRIPWHRRLSYLGTWSVSVQVGRWGLDLGHLTASPNHDPGLSSQLSPDWSHSPLAIQELWAGPYPEHWELPSGLPTRVSVACWVTGCGLGLSSKDSLLFGSLSEILRKSSFSMSFTFLLWVITICTNVFDELLFTENFHLVHHLWV